MRGSTLAGPLIFGLAWFVGCGLVRAALRPSWRGLPTTLRLGLGWAAGAGFAGMATFGAIALAPGHRGLTVGLAMAVGSCAWLVRTARRPVDGPEVAPGRWSRAVWWAGAVGFFRDLGLVAGARASTSGWGAAAGGWDAWSIWTHRARFFYLCPEEWTRGFGRGRGVVAPRIPEPAPRPDRLRLAAERALRRLVAGPDRPADPGRDAPAPGRLRAGGLPPVALALGFRGVLRDDPAGVVAAGRLAVRRPPARRVLPGRVGLRGDGPPTRWVRLALAIGILLGRGGVHEGRGEGRARAGGRRHRVRGPLLDLPRGGSEGDRGRRHPGPGPASGPRLAGPPAPLRLGPFDTSSPR